MNRDRTTLGVYTWTLIETTRDVLRNKTGTGRSMDLGRVKIAGSNIQSQIMMLL